MSDDRVDISNYKFDARPDNADFRDLLYQPSLINVPATIPVGTWFRRKIPVLDQGQEGACFAAGTLVRMADGSSKAIEDLRLLDQVVTAEGNTGPVMQLMVRYFNGELTKISLRGHTRTFSSTPNHPVLTKRGYVAAGDVQVGDYVALTRYLPAGSKRMVIDVERLSHGLRGTIEGTIEAGGVTTKVSALPKTLSRTKKLGRLLGLYAAEGHTTVNKVVWTFGSHEEETLVAETVDLVRSELDAEARLQYRPNNAINVVLYGKHWRRLFEELVPGTAKHGTKRLSAQVTDGPRDYLEGLFWGWMDGDGHFRRSSYQGISASKPLAMNLYDLAQGLGLKPTITRREPIQNGSAKRRQPFYEVTVSVGGGSNSSCADEENSCVWRKVREIGSEPFSGNVYNMHVEGDESYVADGFGVHNCTGFGLATVAHYLLRTRVGQNDATLVSPRMLYNLAQIYDRWPGEDYSGSSCRAAVRGWHKHGVCSEDLWEYQDDVDVHTVNPARAANAATRPLGAYYRVNTNDLTHMHAALAEVGVLYVSARVHQGWNRVGTDGIVDPNDNMTGGHAFALVGYDEHGFWFQNSWGERWGQRGCGRISYADWLKNGQDAWACRLGVPVIL